MTSAAEVLRRGPLYRWHQEAGAEFLPLHGGMVPWRYPRLPTTAPELALADLSLVPRIGVKGWHIWETLAKMGISMPVRNNTAIELADGGMCLRLGEREAMILGSIEGDSTAVESIEKAGSSDGCYPVPRRDTHAWFVLTGHPISSLLSKMCAVDLRDHRFTNHAIAQTSVAAVGAIVLRRDMQNVPAFHLFSDTSSARYLWSSLMRAAVEFQGRVVGFEALKRLASHRP